MSQKLLRGERLLKTAINQILLYPSTWDQSLWHSFCGTRHCIAGHCQILAGLRDGNTTIYDIQDSVGNALGLTDHLSCWLFDGKRELEEIYCFAENFSSIVNCGLWEDYFASLAKLGEEKVIHLKPFNLDEIKD